MKLHTRTSQKTPAVDCQTPPTPKPTRTYPTIPLLILQPPQSIVQSITDFKKSLYEKPPLHIHPSCTAQLNIHGCHNPKTQKASALPRQLANHRQKQPAHHQVHRAILTSPHRDTFDIKTIVPAQATSDLRFCYII